MKLVASGIISPIYGRRIICKRWIFALVFSFLALKEKILRSLDNSLDAYLNFALPKSGKPKHRFVRQLFALYRRIATPIFIQSVQRALKYRITDIATIENIVILKLRQANFHVPSAQIDQDYLNRDAYLEGCYADEVDLSIYDETEDENEWRTEPKT